MLASFNSHFLNYICPMTFFFKPPNNIQCYFILLKQNIIVLCLPSMNILLPKGLTFKQDPSIYVLLLIIIKINIGTGGGKITNLLTMELVTIREGPGM